MSSSEIIRYYDECHIDYRMVWRVRKTLSIHYGLYDSGARTHMAAVENMIAAVARLAEAGKGDKILDAGCGVGGAALWIAENCSADVTGINISRKQLAIAEKEAVRRKKEGVVRFLERDFTETGFPSGSFDAVIFLESGCYAEDKKDIVRESCRLLRKGGRLVMADGFLSGKRADKEDSRMMRRWLSGWAVPNLASVGEIRNILRREGFGDIAYEDVTENVMPSSTGMFRASLFCYPFGKALELLRLRTATQTANIVSAYYQHKTLKKGVWQYGIFSARKL